MSAAASAVPAPRISVPFALVMHSSSYLEPLTLLLPGVHSSMSATPPLLLRWWTPDPFWVSHILAPGSHASVLVPGSQLSSQVLAPGAQTHSALAFLPVSSSWVPPPDFPSL